MERLQTRSLLLEPLSRDDFPWLFKLYADPVVMRYIGSGPRDEAAICVVLTFWLGHKN